ALVPVGVVARDGAGEGAGEGLVRGVELTGEQPADRGERETFLLQVPDPGEPLAMLLRVPGDPALPLAGRHEALGLVETDGVHAHAAVGCQLVDPVSHGRPL